MISDYFDPQMTRFVGELAGVGVLTTLLSYAAMLNSPAQRKENERWLRQGRQDLIKEDRDKARMDAIAFGVMSMPLYVFGKGVMIILN